MNVIKSVMGMDASLVVTGGAEPIFYNNTKKFIDDIPKIFKNVKYVLLNVFQYQARGYKTNMDFCEAIKTKFDALKSDYFFDSLRNSTATLLLIVGNVTIKPQESLQIHMALDNDKTILITGLKYTENGYKVTNDDTIAIYIKKDPNFIREKIIALTNLKKVILTSNNFNDKTPLMKHLKIALKSDKLIIINNPEDKDGKYNKEMLKWFMDKSYTKYYILPTCARNYFLNAHRGNVSYSLAELDMKEPLPYKKSFQICNSTEKITFGDEDDETSIRTITLNEKCHKYEVTFSIDINNFIEVKYQTITYSQVVNLPKNLDANFDKQIPIIGIFGEKSVICTNKDGKYQFLDAWNGVYGKDLFISFAEEKPSYCLPQLLEYKTFVVYDLIKIMSMTIDEINNTSGWLFTITKDAENPVLIEFDNYDGTRKAASPAFLMAMLIKQHLKAIKKEIEQKPKEIGICSFQKFSDDERRRIEEQLLESCELLKIKCVFVNV